MYAYRDDFQPFDYKSEAIAYVRQQRSFKISNAKALEINGDKLGFKPQYGGDFCEHTLLKKGKSWATFNPKPLDDCSTVKNAKKQDVEKLLSAIGAPAHIREFYTTALAVANQMALSSDDDSSDNEE